MGQSKSEQKKQTAQGPLTGSWTHVVRILLFSASIITAYLALATLSKGGQVQGVELGLVSDDLMGAVQDGRTEECVYIVQAAPGKQQG